MIWVLFIISVAVMLLCIHLAFKYDDSYDITFRGFVSILVATLAGLSMIGCFIWGIVTWHTVTELQVVDDNIAMYQEENEKIECQIGAMVMQYQEYETEIFTDIKPESAMTMVSLYPELKSDTLVQEQIKIHTANNQKIKELKEKKINGSVYRWWLYFGK